MNQEPNKKITTQTGGVAQPVQIKPKVLPTKTLVEALNKFQELNITALKGTDNTYFKSTYADLTSVIDACNQGAKYGLCFTQQVHYKNIVLDKQITDTFKDGSTAITYAKRYGLQALFGLGQDDDANSASGVTDKGGKNG